jgi:tellurite resistance protein TehA-like permease
MKILIQILSATGFITAIIGAIYLLISFAKKMLYYPPDVMQEVSEKISKNFYIAGTLITISTICFLGGKQIIKFDFHNNIKHNKLSMLK